MAALIRWQQQQGSIAGFHGATAISHEAFWEQGCDILTQRNITVVPDVICTAGGVTVSYFEWVQDFSSFFWSEDEINARLDKIMEQALLAVWQKSEQLAVSLRTAAYAVACERILTARKERGLYP